MTNKNWTEEDLAAHQAKVAAAKQAEGAALNQDMNRDQMASSIFGGEPTKPFPIIQPKMNSTEEKFIDQILAPMILAGEILAYMPQPFRFMLAHNVKGGANAVSYMPDFLVVYPDRFQIVEVKAKKGKWSSMRDDARVKINVAAEMYPWWEWRIWYLEAGEWKEEVVR